MKRKVSAIILFVFFCCRLSPASAVSKNSQGNKEFKKGKYAEAESLYKDAEIEAPEKKEIAYNLGNAYYRANDLANAEKAYEKARDIKDKKLRKKVLFNMGNNFFREGAGAQDESGQQKLDQAVKTYKELLKYDPSDYAAKYNLERALEKIEQKKKEQQQNKDQNKDKNKDKKDQNKDQNKDQKNDQDKKDKQNQQDKNNKENQEKKDQNQDKNKQADNKEEQKTPEAKDQQPKKPGELSEEEAKRLLDALKQDESDMQKRLMLMRVPTKKREKDW
jgi:Ca-activated chloride channel homolog